MVIKITSEISDHPLDKIFGGIPARLADFTHTLVRHYLSQNIGESYSSFGRAVLRPLVIRWLSEADFCILFSLFKSLEPNVRWPFAVVECQ